MSDIVESAAPAPEAQASSAPTAGEVPANSAPEGTAPEGDAKAGEQPGDQKPARTFTQDDIERIVSRERAKAERRAERFGYERAMREAAERQLAERTAPMQPDAGPRVEGKPSPDQFKDWDAYTEALVDWKAEQKFAERERAAMQAQHAEKFHAERSEVLSKLAPALEKYEDFQDVVGSIPLSRVTFKAALTLGNDGHDVLYHLGNNPREAERIYGLDDAEQVREIDKLAARLKAPPTPTKAPAPITPNSGTASVEKRLENADYDEYVKIRQRQRAASGR